MDKKLQDLAWSILPKEFKEEVENQFRDGFNDDRNAIGRLFGIDNLLSDAEGEEMLYCEKGVVLSIFNENRRILNNITEPDDIKEIRKTQNILLYTLFGSKCLPDEACNVASSDVAGSKPKPTEPKFKRCKKVITPSGEVCIIEDTHFENGCWLCLVGAPARWIPESDLEPYTEPKENVNLSQDSANCDKEFDNIPKDSFSKERRLNIAVQMVKAITQCPEIIERIASAEADSLLDDIVDDALHLTDRLISKCEKGGFK